MNDNLLHFNGEPGRDDRTTYHLGNGYRAYHTALMRFSCPDSWAPFGAGGLHSYAYCGGDPINHADPSGHLGWQAAVGVGLGTLSITFALFTGGASVIAAGSISASLCSASALSLIVGASSLVSDITGILSTAMQKPSPRAACALGWISLAFGMVSMSAALFACPARLVRSALSRSGEPQPLLRGRGPMMAGGNASFTIPMDGLHPHQFRLLGQSPGFVPGGIHNWLDYSFYDYIGGELRLNIAAHGREGRVARLMLEDAGHQGFTATGAIRWLMDNNYPLNSGEIRRVRFLMCHGAKNGYGSFVAQFAANTGITSTGWRGDLGIDGALEDLLMSTDVEFPHCRIFLEGVAQYFVDHVPHTAELLHYTRGEPVTFRSVPPGIIEQYRGEYF